VFVAQNILITTGIGSGEGVNVQSTALGFINCVLIRSISFLDDRGKLLLANMYLEAYSISCPDSQ